LEEPRPSADVLKGTTLKVYRYMYRQGRPVGFHDIQRGLGLSSASVSQYHIQKLLRLGLVKEEGNGYVVDKVVFENVIRVRRAIIPFQTTYSVFFAATLVILLVFLRPEPLTSLYVFALVVNIAALGVSLYETLVAVLRFR
jgi:predicted DNA-binding transcriptional regulator